MKKILSHLLLIGLGVFGSALVIEVTLRLRPELIGQEFANGVLSKYRHGEEGIYYLGQTCEGLYFNLMKPNFSTTAYYNGYRWQHQTDQWGFRNPPAHTPASILLSGDSYIYGHGVDYEQTVGYFLQTDGMHRAYNLGRQGDNIFQQHFLLNQYIDQVNPKYVFYFFYNNDITDLYDLLLAANRMSQTEMEQYFRQAIARPDDHIMQCDWQHESPQQPSPRNRLRPLIQLLTAKPYIARVPAFLSFRQAQTPPSPNAQPQTANSEPPVEPPLTWQYLEQLILEMNAVAVQEGAEFVVVPISLWNFDHHEKLKEIAATNNISFIATYDQFNSGSDPALYLENDGHFSELGAKKMAEMILTYIAQDTE